MSKITLSQIDQLRTDPRVRQMLEFISAAEGTTTHGYQTAFGGGRINDLSRHPNYSKVFTQTDGKKNTTSAAGKYQFIGKTWNALASRYGLHDFGPVNQDRAAIALLAEKGALDPILKGDWQQAINRLGSTWASLPSSPYKQPKRSWDYASKFFGGVAPTISNHAPKTPEVEEINLDELYGIPTAHEPVGPVFEIPVLQAYGLGNKNPRVGENYTTWLDDYINGIINNG